MIRCMAIDDEPLALQQIVTYINKVPFLELATQCQSALEARKFLENDTVDAIFRVDYNYFRNKSTPQLVIIDMEKSPK